MNNLDLNLLTALNVLIEEASVERAARRLHISPSAMSRTLGRVREAFGDEILVRAGKRMVVTETASALHGNLKKVLGDVDDLLLSTPSPERLERTFTISANDAFVDSFGPAILAGAVKEWPGVRFCFTPKHEKDVGLLRGGTVDLEIGVLGRSGPEIKKARLFHDRFVGVCRDNHPLATATVTVERYISFSHVSVSRKSLFRGPVDEALAKIGQKRNVIAVVPNIHSCLQLVRNSDWIAHVPAKHTERARSNLFTFELPVTTPVVNVSMMWHPRWHKDALHCGMRKLIESSCK